MPETELTPHCPLDVDAAVDVDTHVYVDIDVHVDADVDATIQCSHGKQGSLSVIGESIRAALVGSVGS